MANLRRQWSIGNAKADAARDFVYNSTRRKSPCTRVPFAEDWTNASLFRVITNHSETITANAT